MRQILLALLPFCGLFAPSLAGGQEFPYKAHVTDDEVFVRSGPGKDYYATDKLRAGDVVEVYRHDPGGWYAIRPPKGSFTWVSARYLQPTGDGLARVTSGGVAARVGSRLSDVRDMVQVRMNQGETVELLEPNGFDPKQQHWVRIAPPSGEFRWIHSRYLDTEPPTPSRRKASAEDRVEPRRLEGAGRASQWASGPIAITPLGRTDGSFQQRLDALDVALSAMVVREPAAWQFDRLSAEGEALAQQAQSAAERTEARAVLAKIDRFADIKRRNDALDVLAGDSRRGGPSPAEQRNSLAGLPSRDGRFDGMGRLTRVISSKEGAPRYALVNENGDVRYYVTPSPDLNLRHYEGRWIGVSGERGFVFEQQTPHVNAKNVALIDPPLLR